MKNIQKNEIFILYNSVEFFQEHIKKRGYNIWEFYKKETLYTRLLKKIFERFSLDERYLYSGWKNKLKTAKTIILFAPVEISAIRYIKARNPEAEIKYWYWNPAYRIGRPTEELRSLTDIWTFDLNDAKQYKLKYNNTFYFDNIRLKETDAEYDVLFVGYNKHRKDKLLEIKQQFEKSGFRSFFLIVPNRKDKNPEKIKPLSYREYLELVSKSKAILDIMPPSQVGLTLRPMESLFLSKKLITDNKSILNEPFYKPENIFVIGHDDQDRIRQFLDMPYEPVDQNIIMSYDFDVWLERLSNGKEYNYNQPFKGLK